MLRAIAELAITRKLGIQEKHSFVSIWISQTTQRDCANLATSTRTRRSRGASKRQERSRKRSEADTCGGEFVVAHLSIFFIL